MNTSPEPITWRTRARATALAAGALMALSGCGDRPAATAPSAQGSPPPAAVAANPLQQENERLKAEVAALKDRVADLEQTPQVLLEQVQELVREQKLAEAQAVAAKLEQRFGPDGQAKTAKQAIAQLQALLRARQEQAMALEAKGFYALKPSTSITVDGFLIKVDSLSVGNRWLFDSHGYEYHYRDVERGQKFILLQTTLQNTDKSRDPALPDIGVYEIIGKTMKRAGSIDYEFRRWSSYGSFIGLHHDFKNDFAHSSAVAFNAAVTLNEDIAKKPLAVVATGLFCHSRTRKIGQPEVVYRRDYSCSGKEELSADDFSSGSYRVIAFLNRPKGV